MIVSIEDEAAEAAEVANLMARRNSHAATMRSSNGYGFENRRMSKVSKRSHRSSISIGGGSANGGSGQPQAMTTTTAEVCCQRPEGQSTFLMTSATYYLLTYMTGLRAPILIKEFCR